MSVPRKTVKERVLYAHVCGFFECLRIFEEAWRKAAGPRADFNSPACNALWSSIEAAQVAIRKTDEEWRALHFGRAAEARRAAVAKAKAATAPTQSEIYRRRDPRMRCQGCKRWMRFRPTKSTPAKRRNVPHASRCTDCKPRTQCNGGCKQCRGVRR